MYGYMTQLTAEDRVAELLAQAARQRRRAQAGQAVQGRAFRKPGLRPARLRLDAEAARRVQPLRAASGARVTTVRVRAAVDC
jgi:hypothetical protein